MAFNLKKNSSVRCDKADKCLLKIINLLKKLF